jgi:hypothetical protein
MTSIRYTDTVAELVDNGKLGVSRSTQSGEHDMNSDYTDTMWLPLVGPTAYLTLRRFSADLSQYPQRFYDVAELAASLGVGATSEGSPLITIR